MASLLGLAGYDTDSDSGNENETKDSSQLGNVKINLPTSELNPNNEETKDANMSLVSAYSPASGEERSSGDENDEEEQNKQNSLQRGNSLVGKAAVNIENLPPPDPSTAVYRTEIGPISSTPVHYPTPSPFREVKEGEGEDAEKSEGQMQLDSMLDELGEKQEEGDEMEVESFMQMSSEEEALFASLTHLQELPKEPEEECKPELQQRITEYLNLAREKGYNLTENLKKKKEFGNPQILQKVVDFFGIDDIQTNYPKEIYNPHGYQKEDFYDELVLAQRRAQQARQNAHRNTQHHKMVDRMDAAKQQAAEKKAKRASKWGTAPAPNPAAAAAQQNAVLQQQMLVAQAQAGAMGMLGNVPRVNPYVAGNPALGHLNPHVLSAVQQLQGTLTGQPPPPAGPPPATVVANQAAQQQAAQINAQLQLQKAAALANKMNEIKAPPSSSK
mmetsp:Transcript_9115/g.12079  ORF Transcript_9115/g.12079 Transcript_9115/m.12079 type:complete len:444 (-) Transcript_9115:175-1506(-)